MPPVPKSAPSAPSSASIVATPGDHVVLFAAPPTKLTVDRLRTAFAHVAAFVAMLPEAVTPVAALGIAVKAATTPTQRWIHAGQAKGASRWILTAATVERTHAKLEGFNAVEAFPDGRLLVEPGIPPDVAATVRAAYDDARAVVEPSRLTSALARWCAHADRRGAYLRDGVYLLPDLDADTAAILDAVVKLGGLAGAYPVGGAALAALAAPVQRSIEDEIAAVLAGVDDVIRKATAATNDDGANLKTTEDGALTIGETAHRDLDDARARLALWRDRLGLLVGDLSTKLTEAESVMDDALDAAAEAVRKRREARRGARSRGMQPLDRAA